MEKQSKYETQLSGSPPISSQERKLLDVIKDVDYGEIEKITVRKGLPVFVQVAKKDIKLD